MQLIGARWCVMVMMCCCVTAVAAVRLVGDGLTHGEGRVNIYNDLTGQWLPVCAQQWTKQDADVVCRQLGFFSGAAAGPPTGLSI